jgi:hypothetical protein
LFPSSPWPGHPFIIREKLRVDARGLIVPHTVTAEEAEDVVRALKFPPGEICGHAGMPRSAEWEAWPGTEYKYWSDTEPMTGVVIESSARNRPHPRTFRWLNDDGIEKCAKMGVNMLEPTEGVAVVRNALAEKATKFN